MKLSQKEIASLLEELYASDTSLRSREEELKRIIQTLASAKPDVVADAHFLQTLRKTLAEKAKALSSSRLSSMKPSLPNIPSSRFWPAIGFTFSGVAVGMMAMLYVIQDTSILSLMRPKVGAVHIQSPATGDVLTIQRITGKAFGQIAMADGSYQGVPAGMGGGSMNALASSVAPMPTIAPRVSQEGSDSAMLVVDERPSDIVTSATPQDVKMIAPYPYPMTVVEYDYTGDALTLAETSLDVLKRSAGSFSSGALASAVQGMGIDLANLGSFGSARVGDVSIYQDEPYGYQIYVSPRNGTISIDQNWDQWQGAYPSCTDDACWQASRLKASDIPSDDELVRIADAFIQQHGINRSVYGPGEVNRSWEYSYGANVVSMERGNTEIYIPDVVQITYPLLVNGETVYQNGGEKMGLSIGINVRVKRVSSVYNLQQLSFEASAYDAETDANAVLDQAKKGGISSPMRYYADGNVETKIVKAELGTPMKALVQVYQYEDNQSFELYVPALVFPVTKRPEETAGTWVPNAVIVPLVKGIVNDNPTILPMGGVMLKTETPAQGASGSGGGSTGVATPPIAPDIAPAPRQ